MLVAMPVIKRISVIILCVLVLPISQSWGFGGEYQAFQKALGQLEGSWDGVLEYRDYQTGKHESIPHSRTVRPAPDGSYVLMELAYSDPKTQNFATDTYSFGPDMIQSVYVRSGDVTVGQTILDGFTKLEKGWKAILLSSGTDDGQAAKIKMIWSFYDGTLRIEKHVQFNDTASFEFRNQVVLVPRIGTRLAKRRYDDQN